MVGRREFWDEEESYIEGRIRHWSRRVSRDLHLGDEDEKDLAQALRLDLLQRLPAFDPAKASRRTFITLIIEHGARSFSEEHRAAKRGRQFAHVSLDEPADPAAENPVARGEFVSQDEYLEATRAPAFSQEEHRDLVIDLRQAEARLTAPEIVVCRLLREMTKTEAASALGLPRTTLQDIVHRLGGKLARAGLEEYCH